MNIWKYMKIYENIRYGEEIIKFSKCLQKKRYV